MPTFCSTDKIRFLRDESTYTVAIQGDKFHRKLCSEWTKDTAIGYVMIVRSLVWNGNYRVYNHDGQTTQFLATLTTAN